MTLRREKIQCYGHVQRMDEGRLPRKIMKWKPYRLEKEGRSKLTLMGGIQNIIQGLLEVEWEDRGN